MDATLRLEVFPSDIERSIAFYERLGFTLIGRKAGPPRYAWLRLGAVRLGLAERDHVEAWLRMPPAGTEIVVEVDDIVICRDRFLAAGVTLLEDLVRREWGLTDIRLTDPDGYFWRFTDRG